MIIENADWKWLHFWCKQTRSLLAGVSIWHAKMVAKMQERGEDDDDFNDDDNDD